MKIVDASAAIRLIRVIRVLFSSQAFGVIAQSPNRPIAKKIILRRDSRTQVIQKTKGAKREQTVVRALYSCQNQPKIWKTGTTNRER
jgi:hypothetical protein